MFSKLFWKDALERAVSTGAQAVLLVIGGQAADKVVDGAGIMVAAFIGGVVLSLFKSLAASGAGARQSASFTVDTKELK